MARLKRLKRDTAKKKRYLKHFKTAGVKHAMTYGEWTKKGESPAYFKGIKRKSLEAQFRESGLSEADMRSLGYGRKRIKRKK